MKLTEKMLKKQTFTPFEKSNAIRGLSLFVVVVRVGQAEAIRQIFNSYDTAITLTTIGTGISFSHNQNHSRALSKKNFIFAIVREDKAPMILQKLQDRFNVSRAAAGIAYSIDLTSVAGVSVYKFLTNTRKVTKVSKNDKNK